MSENEMTRRDLLKAGALLPVIGLGSGVLQHASAATDPPGKAGAKWPIKLEAQLPDGEIFKFRAQSFELFTYFRVNKIGRRVVDDFHWNLDNIAQLPLGEAPNLLPKDGPHEAGVMLKSPVIRHNRSVDLDALEEFQEKTANLGGTATVTLDGQFVIRLNRVHRWNDGKVSTDGRLTWYENFNVWADSWERLS